MILNSKSEYNRSYISLLQVEKKEEAEAREQDLEEQRKIIETDLREQHLEWEQGKNGASDQERRVLVQYMRGSNRDKPGSKKRRGEKELQDSTKKRSKKRKLPLIKEGWGELITTTQDREQVVGGEPSTIGVEEEGGGEMNCLEVVEEHYILEGSRIDKEGGNIGGGGEPSQCSNLQAMEEEQEGTNP